MSKFHKVCVNFSKINPGWIILLAALLRISCVLISATTSDWSRQNLTNEDAFGAAGVDGYIQLARTLLVSGEYAFAPGEDPVSFRPPLVPFIMAVTCAWSPGNWYWLWMVYSAAAGTATVGVLWLCAINVGMGRLQTNFLLGLAAIHPYLIYSLRVPALPATVTLLATLILLAVIRFVKSDARKPVALGCVWGFASLTHGSFLPLLFPFMATLFFVTGGPWSRRLLGISMTVGITLTVVAPWTIRNYRTFGKPIPVANGGALQWWLGDAMYFHGAGMIKNAFARVQEDFKLQQGRPLVLVHGGVPSLEDDAILSANAKRQIKNNPLIPAKRLVIGLPLFWMTMDGGWKKAMIVGLMNLPYVGLYLVVLVAAAMRRSADRIWLAGQSYFLGYWCLFAIIQASAPYYLAIMPLFLFLIVRGVDHALPGLSIKADTSGHAACRTSGMQR